MLEVSLELFLRKKFKSDSLIFHTQIDSSNHILSDKVAGIVPSRAFVLRFGDIESGESGFLQRWRF